MPQAACATWIPSSESICLGLADDFGPFSSKFKEKRMEETIDLLACKVDGKSCKDSLNRNRQILHCNSTRRDQFTFYLVYLGH